MPPWHANPKHGKFANDARLSDEDKEPIDTLGRSRRARKGTRRTCRRRASSPTAGRSASRTRRLHARQAVQRAGRRAKVRYQYFIVDPGFNEDKWIKAAECRPGNRAVVHHIIVGVVPPGSRRRSRARRRALRIGWPPPRPARGR